MIQAIINRSHHPHVAKAKGSLKPLPSQLPKPESKTALPEDFYTPTSSSAGTQNNFYIKRFSITQTTLKTSVINSPPEAEVPSSTKSELEKALKIYRQSITKPYYDAVKDQRDKEAYYGEIRFLGPGADLYAALSNLVRSTHKHQLPYRPSLYLYPWVDLRPDRKLHSIYSGTVMEPEEVIRQDLLNTAKMVSLIFNPITGALQESSDQTHAAYNCEHVVPQSWFNRQQPMRGDLHHLFAAEPRCNSFRGNLPYHDFPDTDDRQRTNCGRADNRLGFEPEAGKGAVARATLYFLLRYPGEISQYSKDDLKTLIRWHKEYPVSLYEKHRNAAIFALQGNRNPFIDFPEWVDRIDFSRALGKPHGQTDNTPPPT